MSAALGIFVYFAIGILGVSCYFAVTQSGVEKWEYPFAAFFVLLWPAYALLGVLAGLTAVLTKVIVRLRATR